MGLQDGRGFETGLDPTRANFVPLSPVSFLTRAASAFSDKVAVIDGDRRYTYRDLLDRSVRLASALSKLGVGRLDTVAILASNIPELIEAMYAVPMLGAVLNPLNTRLDAANIAFSLKHGGAKVFLVDRDYATFVSRYNTQTGVITASRHIDFLHRQVPAGQSADYAAFLHAVQTDQSQHFTLSHTDAAAHPGTSKAATPKPQ